MTEYADGARRRPLDEDPVSSQERRQLEQPEAENDRDEFVSAVQWASKVQQAYVPL